MDKKTAFIQGAMNTSLTLIGGLVVGIVIGDILFRLIPGSSLEAPQLPHMLAAALPALLGFLGGGAAWGLRMARLAGEKDNRRSAWAGLLGFGPLTIVLALALVSLESFFSEQLGFPVHRSFMLLFTPTAFLITAASTWSLGRALSGIENPAKLAIQVGLAGAAAFLLANTTMEASGWVVGAPGAGARATMIVVLIVGVVTTALVAGGFLGVMLSQKTDR